MNILAAALAVLSPSVSPAYSHNHGGVNCKKVDPRSGRFLRMSAILVSDVHGGYITLSACPETSFSIDFSKSDINETKRRVLREAVSKNAVLPGRPIELVVSGYIRSGGKNEVRDVAVVEKIVSYNLNVDAVQDR